MRASPHLTPDQPGAFQHLDVLGGSSQRHRKGFRKFAHRALAPRKIAQHLPPRGIAQGVKDGIHLRRVKLNHLVEYRRRRQIVN
ncbi:hypothetical protein ES703_49420 [subsurface metagenome]